MNRTFTLVFLLVIGFLSSTGSILAQDLPDNAVVTGIVGYPQTYRLSCESRSAVDLAAYWGVSIGEIAFFESLPASDDPNLGFVGSVHGAWGNVPPLGYGVHAEPVAATLRSHGLDARAALGLTWDDLRAEIASGRPVIVWLIGSVWAGTAQQIVTGDGSLVTVAPFEHTMLVTGYTPNTVTLVDAADGQTKVYRVIDFLTSWAVLGNMAVLADGTTAGGEPGVSPEMDVTSQAPPSSVSASNVKTYVVQPGDRLASIAAQFGVSWPDLARLNGLAAPYVIYVGQILTVEAAASADEVSIAPGEPAAPSASQSVSEQLYVVQPGDYLTGIAARYGLDWLSLARVNALAPPYIVYVGQQLRVPSPAAGAAESLDTPATYIVQPGESLLIIAQRFGLDWQVLAALNGLSYPDRIYAYQVLRLR